MSQYPCKNTNCNSYGKPHPNCKCYGGMAEGGNVKSFCDQGKSHISGCEYYADGGEVGTLGDMDSQYAVAGHIVHGGLLGMLKMHKDRDLSRYDKSVNNGHKRLDSHVETILTNGKPEKEDRSKNYDIIEKWINRGGIDHHIQQEVYKQNQAPQMMAEGGIMSSSHDGVHHNHPIEKAYPQQNIMLNEAKGRVSNYLSSMQPQQNSPKLAFDSEPDQTSQKKSYAKAVKIADHPLSVMRDIAKGTIDPEEIKHLTAMYPEVHDTMQKKVTEKIIESQLNGKRPNSKVRQGLSALMGTALSGEFTSQGIMAAQATFANKKQPQQSQDQSKPKKNTTPLSKSDSSFLTSGQSLVKRSQKTN